MDEDDRKLPAEEDEDDWSRQVETDEVNIEEVPPFPQSNNEALTLKEQQILRERQRRIETQRLRFKRQFLNSNQEGGEVAQSTSEAIEEESVVGHPDETSLDEPPLGFNMERFLRNSDDFQPEQEETVEPTPVMERFLNEPVLLDDPDVETQDDHPIVTQTQSMDNDTSISEEQDHQRILRLTEEDVQAMAAIDEASLGNAPPSEREDLSEVGELADFQSPPTNFSVETPTTVLESASNISANGSVAANPPSERGIDDEDIVQEESLPVSEQTQEEQAQHLSELLGMKAAPHTSAMLNQEAYDSDHIPDLMEYGTLPRKTNGFAHEEQPLLSDIPPEITARDKHNEIHNSSGMRSIFSHVLSEEQHDEVEIHNDSQKYAKSGVLARAFPERLFALIVTMILEIPVLFMISGGSDSLCVLLGRKRYQLLVGFIPLTSAISGNVGLQASSLTTRGISHEHVTVENYIVWFLKEVSAAASLGISMGLVLGGIAFTASGHDFAFGFTIFIAQLISMVTAGITGTIAPILFTFIFRRDAGKWSGPLETAIQDIIGSFALVIVSYKILSFFGRGEIDPSDVCGPQDMDSL